jgi:hypothetical protein
MPHKLVTWRCDKCSKLFSSYDVARDCEIGHVTRDAIDSCRDEIDRIFRRTETPREGRAWPF